MGVKRETDYKVENESDIRTEILKRYCSQQTTLKPRNASI